MSEQNLAFCKITETPLKQIITAKYLFQISTSISSLLGLSVPSMLAIQS